MTLAARVHEAQIASMKLESELFDAIRLACGELHDGESWTTDYYDNSIEVYGVRGIDLTAAAAALKACGFSRVWLHQHESPRGDCKCPAR